MPIVRFDVMDHSIDLTFTPEVGQTFRLPTGQVVRVSASLYDVATRRWECETDGRPTSTEADRTGGISSPGEKGDPVPEMRRSNVGVSHASNPRKNRKTKKMPKSGL